MPAPRDLLGSAMVGAHISRYGDVVLVAMQGFAFQALTLEFQQCQQWGRAKASTGNAQKDRMLLVNRIENLIARVGSGIASKGNDKVLLAIATVMKQNGLQLEDWSIPRKVLEELNARFKPPQLDRKKPDDESPATSAKPEE